MMHRRSDRALAAFMIAASGVLMLSVAAMVNRSRSAAETPADALPIAANAAAAQAREATLEARGLLQRVTELETQMASQERFAPPVGTVVAFAGSWPPAKSATGNWTEAELGWMLADGRAFSEKEFPELALALGASYRASDSAAQSHRDYRLPDLRCVFLRGIDSPSEDGKLLDMDEDHQRRPGSFQAGATALPSPRNGQRTAFVTNTEPAHDLTYPSSP